MLPSLVSSRVKMKPLEPAVVGPGTMVVVPPLPPLGPEELNATSAFHIWDLMARPR